MSQPASVASPVRQESSDRSGRRLYQALAAKLRGAILAGRYVPGDRLPGERDLAIEYDVSRPTVREALIALEVQGVVTVRLGSGAYVREVPPDRRAQFGVTAFELTEARLMFEGEAAALAASLIEESELEALAGLVARMERERGAPDGGEDADRAFHLTIARATRNAAVVQTVENLWALRAASPEAALLHAHARDAAVRPVAAEHVAIVDALRLRDPARARAAMRDHLNAVLGHLLFATEEQLVEAARHPAVTGRVRYPRAAAW